MHFQITKNNYPWPTVLRRLGYYPLNNAYVKRLGADYYPRFQIYAQSEDDNGVSLTLHLDQRKGRHEGIKAHAADDDSSVVQEEVQRIQQAFSKIL
ncbi:MAG: hypothetical protein CO133_01305 [Candidatus Komeilibacteria bacterium CG_4_9_14_3_um_filter_37_5]|nr:MAG: hypothetical protein CO133_01305 [Candidatus Komeilibacteria bacterium CG_4_9_14_3_um_filter_37_5]